MIHGELNDSLDAIAEADLAELRTAVNNTRACLRGLHKMARAANALVGDLEERLESFDHRIAQANPAQEAQNGKQDHHRVPPVVAR